MMQLVLSEDERRSISYYLSTLEVQGLIDLGAFFLRIEGSDELSRLVCSELSTRPEAVGSVRSCASVVGGIPPDLADDFEAGRMIGSGDEGDDRPFPHYEEHE